MSDRAFLGSPEDSIKSYIQSKDKLTLKVSWKSDGEEISQPVKFWYSLDNGTSYTDGEWDKVYSFSKGTNVTLKCSAETVVYFTKWSDEVTDNPRTITLTENKEMMAIFHQNWS